MNGYDQHRRPEPPRHPLWISAAIIIAASLMLLLSFWLIVSW